MSDDTIICDHGVPDGAPCALCLAEDDARTPATGSAPVDASVCEVCGAPRTSSLFADTDRPHYLCDACYRAEWVCGECGLTMAGPSPPYCADCSANVYEPGASDNPSNHERTSAEAASSKPTAQAVVDSADDTAPGASTAAPVAPQPAPPSVPSVAATVPTSGAAGEAISPLPGRLTKGAIAGASQAQLLAWLAEAERIKRASAVKALRAALGDAAPPPPIVLDDAPPERSQAEQDAEEEVRERWETWAALDALLADLRQAQYDRESGDGDPFGSEDEIEPALRSLLSADAHPSAAAWLCERLRYARQRVDDLQVLHATELRRAQRDVRDLEDLLPLLEEWVRAHPPEGKARSLTLPGTLARPGWRKVSRRLVIDDHTTAAVALERAVGWDAAQGALRTTTRVLPGEARRLLEERGIETLDGAHVRPEGDRFDVR